MEYNRYGHLTPLKERTVTSHLNIPSPLRGSATTSHPEIPKWFVHFKPAKGFQLMEAYCMYPYNLHLQ
jgi:hypothetical protein